MPPRPTPNTPPHLCGLRIGMAGVSILAAAVLAACSGGHAEEAGAPPPPQVSAAPVLVKQVSQWDEFSGRVEAVQSVELRPRVSGYIDKVIYVEGQAVKKGDLLFVVDRARYRIALEQAKASLAERQASVAQLRREIGRAGHRTGRSRPGRTHPGPPRGARTGRWPGHRPRPARGRRRGGRHAGRGAAGSI
ncbi:hypothetical protein G6F46_013861 [Rhizopus delemar]|nr:hypothetical protein G6F46_013861 [Rhizopus delemar]